MADETLVPYPLYDWTAKRARGIITVRHAAGKITCVETITFDRRRGQVIAAAADGKRYMLSVRPVSDPLHPSPHSLAPGSDPGRGRR